ncbi:F-box protein PP2-B10-like [Papaver somniferum]|uniref:F-box protein PP2-B10-like n=1 Tax=Papaver somniferum TaxID=3469 RepID=UPI000E6F9460|nr:F-box protein PP2-B10-like [Papaver somniferum]
MERAEKEEVVVEISEDIINNIERLPEGCISDILSLTSPADACRSSLVSTLFKSAADSDALWEKFLPADYQDIISRAFYPFLSVASSKKELYYRLCDYPLLIDGGLKSFQLEKSSGKKCIMLGAKELGIAWGDTPRYWYWRGYPGSKFPKVAELKWVCWLEIRGKLDTRFLSPKTFYTAYLVLKFHERVVYGLDYQPIKAKVEVVGRAGGNSSLCNEERCIYLTANREHASRNPKLEGQYFARERGDGWMEVELGHFYNEESEDDEGGEVHMSVLETERLGAKYGIIVQGMELRPKAGTQIP